MMPTTRRWLRELPGALRTDFREIERSAGSMSRVLTLGISQVRAEIGALIARPKPDPQPQPSGAGRNPLPATDARWMTKRELAEHLRVSTRWIEKKQKHDGLRSYLVGGVRRYRLDEIEAWIEMRSNRR
jgi:excisionase family DNA binding protein